MLEMLTKELTQKSRRIIRDGDLLIDSATGELLVRYMEQYCSLLHNPTKRTLNTLAGHRRSILHTLKFFQDFIFSLLSTSCD